VLENRQESPHPFEVWGSRYADQALILFQRPGRPGNPEDHDHRPHRVGELLESWQYLGSSSRDTRRLGRSRLCRRRPTGSRRVRRGT